MQKPNDLNQSRIVLKQDSTLIAVIEMSLSSWLVAGIVPGVERQPLKKLAVDESALLKLLNRWREEAEKAGRRIERITVAFEAGRDGFWLARWLRARGIEAHVIHASSVAVSREHRRCFLTINYVPTSGRSTKLSVGTLCAIFPMRKAKRATSSSRRWCTAAPASRAAFAPRRSSPSARAKEPPTTVPIARKAEQ